MDKHNHSTTIETAKRIETLREFRLDVEAEANIGLADIETNLALALADIAETLGIKEPDHLRRVLGSKAYLQIYVDPIPYRPKGSPHNKALLLLAKIRDIYHGKWGSRPKPEAEPC